MLITKCSFDKYIYYCLYQKYIYSQLITSIDSPFLNVAKLLPHGSKGFSLFPTSNSSVKIVKAVGCWMWEKKQQHW